MKRKNFDIDYVIESHNAGRSIKSLSEEIGISRITICRHLERSNYKQKNRSEAMYQRMKDTSPEDRKKLTQKANFAVRGNKKPESGLIKRARGVEKNLNKQGKFKYDISITIVIRWYGSIG